MSMNWQQLLSAQRFKQLGDDVVPTKTPSSQEGIAALRTDFHIDYDRVVFSGAFRRLGRKTQVHPFAENDLTHNRLTHSVEVASVGRSIGNRVGAMLQHGGFLPPSHSPQDIGGVVQVACLAHDLGNPPFGHTGEDALRDWFRVPEHQRYLQPLTQAERNDIETYEGNSHSLRMVSALEMYRHRGGMRLTAATIGSLLKYPWTSSEPIIGRRKFNIYQTELPYVRRVVAELGLLANGQDRWVRHPLSYLMEAADDICYALLDLEDAVEIGLISDLQVEAILSKLTFIESTWQAQSPRQKCAMLRGIAIGRAVEDVAQTFMLHQQELLQGVFQGKDLLSFCSDEVRETLDVAKDAAKNYIFRHPSKLMIEIAAFPCVGQLLQVMVPAAYSLIVTRHVSSRQSLVLDLLQDDPICKEDSLYAAYMKILDYIGGMTDNKAAKMAREISGVGML